MNGKTSGLFRAIVHFIDSQGSPLGGKGWTARVRDQDCVLDDLLGEESVDADGTATFLISVADIKSLDSPDERRPDLYFTLYRDGREVFRSKVLEDVDFEALDAVSGEPSSITREFGPYCVEAA
ncbi:MAG: hypothetical protein HKN58_07540 [Xanthomonadales bacterium]|nr:hypothetical protein [Xanthomonadales bacterium]